MMKLGQLIRKWRCATTGGEMMIPCNEMLRILDAADLGLHLQLTMPEEMEKYSRTLVGTQNELSQVAQDRTGLRQEYAADLVKIKQLGFKDLEEMLYWAQKQNVKVIPSEDKCEVFFSRSFSENPSCENCGKTKKQHR